MTAQTHRLNDIQFYYEYRVDSIANALLSSILLCVSIAHDTDYENTDTTQFTHIKIHASPFVAI